ncbi:MAG: helix-turn-helix domain-containing protein [Crocinitomicaceae bacterium]
MEISSTIIILVLTIGAVQGIVFSFILFRSSKYNKTANRILAAILILLSYRLLIQTLRLFGLGYYDGWYYFMIDLSWAHGALLYFYTKAQIRPNLRFKWKYLLHFIPLVLQIVISVFVRLQNLYWDGTKESLSWLGYYAYSFWMNKPTIYIVASVLIIIYSLKARKILASSHESLDIPATKSKWIKRIIHAFLIYFVLVLIVLVADLILFKSINHSWYFYFMRFYFYPFFIGIAILTYWIGLEGFSRRNDPEISVRTKVDPKDLEQLEAIAERIQKAMRDDKLYKNPELSVNNLAKELNLKPYLISKSLNAVFNKRFNDFVNEYRVEEFQRLLKDSDNSKYTLLSLALESGFNSKSSFNRAIKKQLGISPSDLKLNP